MTYAPVPPAVRVAPERIAPDTHLIHQVQPATGAPLSVYINSMVITGAEPVVVDTGTVANRSQWLDDVFGLVDPVDVRWIYLSHDDHDHTGNVVEALTLAPNATLVASWAIVERISNAIELPLERMRWVNDGDTFATADRTFKVVRPPIFDSPSTRGLFDPTTGVYWGVDTLPALMDTPVQTVADLDPTMWRETAIVGTHHLVSPWLSLVDPQRYSDFVDRVQVLGIDVLATAHSPIVTRESMVAAFDLIREMPNITPPAAPDQTVLDAMRGALAVEN
jgi:flavorubredoxin